MKKISLSLDGMGCGGCVKNVRKALDALPGVVDALAQKGDHCGLAS